MISHRLWRQRFGSATDVVGREIRLNGEPTTVVGVAPAAFPLPLQDIDVIVPLVPDRDPVRHLRSSTNFLRMFGRLRDGVTAEQARQDLTAISVELRASFPTEYAGKMAMSATPLAGAIVGDHRPTVVLLLGAVVVVLTTTLANLICLVLIRTNDRRTEISIRMAIGASRRRVIRQLAIEALSLTLIAGAVGVGLSMLTTASTPAWAPAAIPRLSAVGFDGRALTFAAMLTLIATAVFTLAPLGVVWRTHANHVLHLGSRGGNGDRWHHRLRDALVVAEIAAALVLLVATSLLVREFVSLQRVQPGFTPDAVFQARVTLPMTYRTPADLSRFHDELQSRLTTMPGVRDVGVVSAAPMSGMFVAVPFSVVGAARPEQGRLPSTNFRVMTPGYLATAGTRLLRGRAFTDRDRADTAPVAIVSEAMATRWLGDDPLGKRVMIDDNHTGPRPVEVVGVVENVRQMSMSGPAGFDLYIPLAQTHPDAVTFLRNNQFWMIRGDGDPEVFRKSFVTAIQSVERDAAVSTMGTIRQGLQAWFAPRRFSLALSVAFSITAVLLAVSGLYGLVSYAVSQRRREIGLRMALGASTANVKRLILRDAARLAAAGIVIGAALAFAAKPLTSSLIGDIAIDPAIASATAGTLFAIVLFAGALPAWRASPIEPTVALKGD